GRPFDAVPSCSVNADAGPAVAICGDVEVTLDGSATEVTGCAGATQYRWLLGTEPVRDWSADPTVKVRPPRTAAYRLEARCGTCGTSCAGAASVVVTVTLDTIPSDQGNVLHATKRVDDVDLSFAAATPLATRWRLYRDADKLVLGTTA